MPLLSLGRYRDLATAVAERLDVAGSPLEVIVASSGVRAAVLGELLRRTPSGVRSVRLDSLEAFARRVVNECGEYPRLAGDGERRLAMRTAVRAIDDPILESRGVAAMLERSYRDVRDSGLSLDDFEARMRGSRALRNRTRTQLVLRVWRDYERLIKALGAIDPADVFGRAAALLRRKTADSGLRAPAIAPQIVAGFYDMTGAQLKLIEALRETERLDAIFIPASEDESYAFARPLIARFEGADFTTDRARTNKVTSDATTQNDPQAPPHSALSTDPSTQHSALSTDLSTSPSTQHSALPSAPGTRHSALLPSSSIAAHRTAVDEIRAVCAEIARLIPTGATVGIVARSLDAQVADLVNRAAAEHGFATTAADELPLRAHRIGRAVAILLRLRERLFPRGDVFELLRAGLRTQQRIDIDRADFETRRARIAGGSSEELRPLSRRSIIDDYIRVVAELETLTAPLASPLTGNEWASFLARAASLFRAETEHDLDALDAFDEIATLFRAANAWNARFDPAAVEDAIARHELRQPGHLSAPQPVVWAGDVMRMRGRTFDHLFAIRMQDDAFPQRRVDDPLLPDADRRALGLREIGDGRSEERLLFQLLLDSAKEKVHFTFAGGDGFGKALRPSQLLKAFAVAREPERKVALLKDFAREVATRVETAADSQPRHLAQGNVISPQLRRQLQLLAKSGTKSPFDGYLTDLQLRPHFERILQSVSPTQLEDFGECPQKFLFKHILGAVDIDQPDRELQMHPREKGTLDHAILERFYRGGELGTERLHAIVEEDFDRIEAESPPFNRAWREIERRATKRALTAFVAADLAEMEKLGLAPAHYEYRFGSKYAARGAVDHAEPFVIDAHGISLRVDGRIDRIDADSSGGDTLRIVDYKSGKALRHKDLGAKVDRGVRLQLALYAMAVASFFEREPESVHGAIKPLVLAGVKSEKFGFALADKAARLTETLDLFARSILAGIFPAFPGEDDDDDVNACKYCPVAHSCRTRHDSVEKYAVRRWKEPRALIEAALR